VANSEFWRRAMEKKSMSEQQASANDAEKPDWSGNAITNAFIEIVRAGPPAELDQWIRDLIRVIRSSRPTDDGEQNA